MTAERKPRIVDINEIMQLLPHRYPFLLVDRVLDFEEGKWITAVKNVSVNEPCFTGHFPNKPIFPGVLILEALAQAAGVLAFKTTELSENELYYFAAIDNARFKRPVMPGDQLVLKIEFERERRGVMRFKGIATVDEQLVCEADLMCARRGV